MASSSMEPAIHCAKPTSGCEADEADLIDTERVAPSELGEIMVFETPDASRKWCGFQGTHIHRLIGLPGETVEIRLEGGKGSVYVNGEKLDEPYIAESRRATKPSDPSSSRPTATSS
jgi:signal peptidase I